MGWWKSTTWKVEWDIAVSPDWPYSVTNVHDWITQLAEQKQTFSGRKLGQHCQLYFASYLEFCFNHSGRQFNNCSPHLKLPEKNWWLCEVWAAICMADCQGKSYLMLALNTYLWKNTPPGQQISQSDFTQPLSTIECTLTAFARKNC